MSVRDFVNQRLDGKEPFEVARNTAAATALIGTGAYVYYNYDDVKATVLETIFKTVKAIPAVSGHIDKEKEGIKKGLNKDLIPVEEHIARLNKLPEDAMDKKDLLRKLKILSELHDKHWSSGKVSGTVYHGGQEHMDFQSEVFKLFSLSNPLHPEVFPAIRKFEAEIIMMTKEMMRGDDKVVGCVTSGGTESILMAIKAARDQFKHIRKPEMIVPVTVHAAFDKGAAYFGIKIIHIPVDKDMKVIVSKVRAAITKNTIMIVGSAPQFPHGVVDPIPALSNLALQHGINFHTDTCLGSFCIPYIREQHPDKIPHFDFHLPGVTSMSVDTHKYGYSVKGTSVLLFKNNDYRKHMYFVQPNWPGGTYATPTISGSRSGAVVACTWASLVTTGRKKFAENAEIIYQCVQKIKEGIKRIPDVELVGDTYTSVIAWRTPKHDVFKLSDLMKQKGWHMNNLQFPTCSHMCVTYAGARQPDFADIFIREMEECMVELRKMGSKQVEGGSAAVYGVAATIPDRGVVADFATAFIDALLTL